MKPRHAACGQAVQHVDRMGNAMNPSDFGVKPGGVHGESCLIPS